MGKGTPAGEQHPLGGIGGGAFRVKGGFGMIEPLRAFQKEFVRRALAPGVDVAALSIPRGNGKSWLAAHLLTRCLSPGDSLHVHGSEYLLCAASIEQARLVYRFIRAELEPMGGYSFIDSTTRISITHKRSNTRLRVLSSNGKTAMGIVGCPLLVADEPGSWETNGGTLMYDAIITALGKPNSPMRTVFIGTLAPAMNRSAVVPLEAPMLTLTGAPDLKVYDSLLTGGWLGCDDGHRRHAGTHR